MALGPHMAFVVARLRGAPSTPRVFAANVIDALMPILVSCHSAFVCARIVASLALERLLARVCAQMPAQVCLAITDVDALGPGAREAPLLLRLLCRLGNTVA